MPEFFLTQHNFQKVAEEKNSWKQIPFTTNTSFWTIALLHLGAFSAHMLSRLLALIQASWLWIPFRMAQNVMCHDLAKLQIIQSCDLLTVLCPGWGFHNFATQIKTELWKKIPSKVEFSVNSFDTPNVEQRGILNSLQRGIPHSLKIAWTNIWLEQFLLTAVCMNITLNWNMLPRGCCFWQKGPGLSGKTVSTNVFWSKCCDLPASRNVCYCLPFEMAGFRHRFI